MVRVIPRTPRLPLAYPCPSHYLHLSRGLLLPFSPFATFPRAINSRAYTQVAPLFCQVHTGRLPLEIAARLLNARSAHGGGNDDRLSYANGSRQRARDDDGKKRLLRGRVADISTHSVIRTLARWSSLQQLHASANAPRDLRSNVTRESHFYSVNLYPRGVFCKNLKTNLARVISCKIIAIFIVEMLFLDAGQRKLSAVASSCKEISEYQIYVLYILLLVRVKTHNQDQRLEFSQKRLLTSAITISSRAIPFHSMLPSG